MARVVGRASVGSGLGLLDGSARVDNRLGSHISLLVLCHLCSKEPRERETCHAAQSTQREGWWTLRLGAPPEQPYWVCAGKSVAPYKIGGIVKHQEEAWESQRLLQRVRTANAEAAVRENDLKETLDALNWSAASLNGTWTRKNSWCRTNARDSNQRGFIIGALFGLLPVALREWAWYPQSYPQAEWRNCPLCHTEVKT
ncbi:hypothetical protein GGI03_006772 [Coemansia sp. RSA 2337]|nr:hypothetical protein GGI03_006772 [Coemansia sp. RSA 2337]